MSAAPKTADQKLYRKAADALVRWRRLWIAEHGNDSGPKAKNGFDCDEEKLWRIAGEIMKARGEKVDPQYCEYHGGRLPCLDCADLDAEESTL